MPEIAVINRSARVDQRELAFVVEACRRQQLDTFCPAYSFERWPVVSYATAPPNAYPITLVDAVPDGELGDHSSIAGLIEGRVLVDDAWSVTLSHEICELRADPMVNDWRPFGGGWVAYEVGDPVERDTYAIDVTIDGETRSVDLSNFVLPSWFVAGSDGPWDYLALLNAPGMVRPGGYLITRDRLGNVTDIFSDAKIEAHAARNRVTRKFANSLSRTARRHASARAPR